MCVVYFSWVTGEWEECSKSCGKTGSQTRLVRCVRPELDGSYKAINAKYCNDDRPEGRRPCNHHLCPAQWRTGPWSQVSRTRIESLRVRYLIVCAHVYI